MFNIPTKPLMAGTHDAPIWHKGQMVRQQSTLAFLAVVVLIVMCALLIKRALDVQQNILQISAATYHQQFLLVRISKEATFLIKNAPLLDSQPSPIISEQLLLDIRRSIGEQLKALERNNRTIISLLDDSASVPWISVLSSANFPTAELQAYQSQMPQFIKHIRGLIKSAPKVLYSGLESWRPEFLFMARENMLVERLTAMNQSLQKETLKKNQQIVLMCGFLLILFLLGLYLIWSSIFSPLAKCLEQQDRSLQISHQKLHHLAYFDDLCGLPNRKAFAHHCQRLDLGQGATLISMDIDCFKTINDSFGHASGDQILRQTGRLLGDIAIPPVHAYRLGGDEFIILIEQAYNPSNLEILSQTILTQFRQQIRLPETHISFSCSLGAAVSRSSATSIDDLLSISDMALYRVKEELGGDNWLLIDSGLSQLVQKTLSIDRELRFAVERQEFAVRYEPIVDLETGHVLGFEALARWHHPQRGTLAPQHWLAEAERLKLLSKITSQVLAQALEAFKRLQARYAQPLFININVTSALLLTGTVLEFIRTHTNKNLAGRSWIGVEITESIMLDRNSPQILSQLNQIRQQNVEIFLDDFGTGFASLNHLKKIPFDTLKIDKSFVSQLLSQRDDEIIVSTMLQLARDLGKRTICEGIESANIAHHLKKLGAHCGQGYLFSQPMSLDEAEHYLEHCRLKQKRGLSCIPV